jgi:hypothetical protein
MSTEVAPEQALPPVGYSPLEVESILGLPHKRAYALIRERKLTAFVDSTGKIKVSQYQLMKYMEDNV